MNKSYTKEDFSYVMTLNSLAIEFGGDNRIITSDDPLYPILVKSIREQNWERLARDLSSSMYVKEYSDNAMQVVNGCVEVMTDEGWKAVPVRLGAVIKEFIAENQPAAPLVRFAQKLLRNPSERSIEQLFNFIEANNITITDDGCFLTYKKITKDYKDIHSKTFDNRPGQSPKMKREDVNDDPEVTCSRGLHVAAYEYGLSFGGSAGEILVLCKVSPENVVSVPIDYNNQKIRVMEYTVVKEIESEIKDRFYSLEQVDYTVNDL